MTPASVTAAQQSELAHVQHGAHVARVALRERDRAIRKARAAGLSLRQIAEAAGMTAMGVRGICERGEA